MPRHAKYPYVDDFVDNEVYVFSTIGQGPVGPKGERGDVMYPSFADPIDWDKGTDYPENTVVLYDGASYLSKQAVPHGIEITDTRYWQLTNNYNAQIEAIKNIIPSDDFDETNTVKKYIEDKTNYMFNVLYYGADNTGMADSADAINDAISLSVSTAKTQGIIQPVIIPAGTYRIESAIRIPQYVCIATTGAVKIECYASVALDLYIDELTSPISGNFWIQQTFPTISGGLLITSKVPNAIGIKIDGSSNVVSNANVWGWHEFHNVTITKFKYGMSIVPRNTYLMRFYDFQFSLCETCLRVESYSVQNAGEMIEFYSCVFGDCTTVVDNLTTSGGSFEFAFKGCSFDFVKDDCFKSTNEMNIFLDSCHLEGLGIPLPSSSDEGTGYVNKNQKGVLMATNCDMAIRRGNEGIFKNASLMNCRINTNSLHHPKYLGDTNTIMENCKQIDQYFIVPSNYSNSLLKGNFTELALNTVVTEGMTINSMFANQYTGGTTITTIQDENGGGIHLAKSSGSYITFVADVPIEQGKFYFPYLFAKLNSGDFRAKADVTYQSGGNNITTFAGNWTHPSSEYGGIENQRLTKPPVGADNAHIVFILNPTVAFDCNVYDFGFYRA